MSLRASLILSFLFATIVIFGTFIHWASDDIQPRARASGEDSLVEYAEMLAAILSTDAESNGSSTPGTDLLKSAVQRLRTRVFDATIYAHKKTRTDARIYVTNRDGVTLFDSEGEPGKDFSKWNDVRRTLDGKYGARTTRDVPSDPATTVLYVSAPIIIGGKIEGVVAVGKPALPLNNLVSQAQTRLVVGATLTLAVASLLTAFLTYGLTQPLARLRDYANAIRDGERVGPAPKARGEIGEVTHAFEEMREALEGRRYVEQYVQSLSHELKSPIAGIAASAELLGEQPKAEDASQFVQHIRSESKRLHSLVENMLRLSALERRDVSDSFEEFELTTMVRELVESADSNAKRRGCSIQCVGDTVTVRGNANLLSLAVSNLLQNAIDFSPVGSTVTVNVSRAKDGNVEVSVSDQGPGMPDFAQGKVFERFFSLPRPDTGVKGSGLGLTIVREIMDRHGGSISLENLTDGGARATVSLPNIPLQANG